ncbi:phytoene desaturase family protein [Rubinisphaera brasiliensis]|uniref:Fumarate reductase/succinate dehydrogenase flavoprotein domain protein n=1 Tax=Rubinisphaera brasiliensis (strain ATCC 49424 / DSM 5305 / JCM 21570 / IAM 15109 / NBRC 103401 / IFAM 1448) TaxID=756272 RepID=F0SN21_RUBBR|nr:NAD(P)/FAD-dependent oxidoreductase [Rubinisphaera brasiliensis]ADY61050.1 fumarate reductase/succinate dehydrogenase flavoprotein domain protein [Rubinisphaera brasiliensis DSM 5305]
MHYDTLIIGAGLSGLAAGIRCAYFDQRVCVLERHTTIGGLNSFYRLRGRNHDVGLHAVTNYAAPGTKTGPLSKLLRQLRIRWEDFALCEQVGSSVVFPGATLRFTNDFELLQQEIVETFPEEKDNFQRFHSHLLEFNELDLHQEVQSAREVVGRFLNNPLLIDMLFCPLMFYGSARPDDMDWNQFVIMYKSIFMEGFARPYKGVRPIMKTLVRKYREVGGELRLRAGVNRILVEDGRAVGVELDNGERLTADRIVSSAGSVETLKLCDDEAKASSEPRLLEPGDVTFNEIIDVINVQPADLGHDRTIIFFSNSESFHYRRPDAPCDLQSGIICSPNNYQYDEPLSEGCIRLTALANHHYWLNLDEADYEVAKAEWTAKIRETALAYLPDYREHILDTDAFTPKTIRRFTGHVNGVVYGAPNKSLDGTLPVKNVFVCGTDQGFLGIVGSMLSGITMANNHCLT